MNDGELYWKPISHDICFDCGSSKISVTDYYQENDETIWDGEKSRCDECGSLGMCCVDEYASWILWDSEN